MMRTRTSEAGFTIVEVILAASIMLIIVGMAIYGVTLGQKSVNEGIRRSTAEQNVARALSVMLPEIRQSGMAASGSEIAISANGDGVAEKRLTFRRNEGFDGTNITWSQPISFEWRAASPDGRYQNVILRSDATGAVSRVGAGIDPTFRFALGSGGDQVQISIASTIVLNDRPNSSVTYSVTETALLRN
jgi:type II secretory pathway pseudopilin PulG